MRTILILLTITIFTFSCQQKSEFQKMKDQELASGIRNDSLFFGIYLVCLMLIGCLFLIKNDATRIRSAEMVVPELKDFTPVRKRIRLVQMNPIKKFAPAKLL